MNNWLNGITILDISSLLPCPFSTHLLAKFGAKVIKIESPNRLDPARNFGFVPPATQNNPYPVSSCYTHINSNKDLILLDLKDEVDQKKFYELVNKAHAVVEGYRPAVRKKLGFDYETLRKHNSKIVLCSAVGFNPNGTLKDRAGHDVNFVARSGILDQTRDEKGNCVLPGLPIGDYLIAYSAALRVVSAIFGAQTTGKGCHIELSIEETLAEAQGPFLQESLDSKHFPRAGESLVSGKYPCYHLYKVENLTFALGALEEKFWELFCSSIQRKDLISHQFATSEQKKWVVAEIEKTLAKQSANYWREHFANVDCCIEPVLTLKEVVHGL